MTAWLRCRLDSGMFSDEFAVTYPPDSKNEWQTSVFVPSRFIRQDSEHRGAVQVNVLGAAGQRYAVELPTPELDLVSVEGADLSEQNNDPLKRQPPPRS